MIMSPCSATKSVLSYSGRPFAPDVNPHPYRNIITGKLPFDLAGFHYAVYQSNILTLSKSTGTYDIDTHHILTLRNPRTAIRERSQVIQLETSWCAPVTFPHRSFICGVGNWGRESKSSDWGLSVGDPEVGDDVGEGGETAERAGCGVDFCEGLGAG
jgi:hypothetical protein